MQLKSIGEFGLIERIKSRVKLDSRVIQGIGDDCAVIRFNKERFLLFSCDMIVEDVDFRRTTSPYLIGRKALAVCISDIAACAGTPEHALVAVGLPKNISVEFTDKIIKGISDLANKYHINLVGGDISQAQRLVIDVSILGTVRRKHLVLRSGAKKGDIICVTGSLGGSIAGKHLKFTPRLKEAYFLVKNFKINSMIDISDGLAADLGHILAASKVGACIYETLIPVSQQARDLNEALYSGEDFELLFTLARKDAWRLLRKNKNMFKPIGEITDKRFGLILIDKHSREHKITPRGFRHF
jgi:thiamine-monophosphate kinase